MKKIILIAAISCLFANLSYAQPEPEVVVDLTATSCGADLEMRLTVLEQNTFIQRGITIWFPIPAATTINWFYLWNNSYWVTDPDPYLTSFDWAFFTIEIRNCNTPGTGTTGPNCGSGLLDGVTLACFGVNNNCFEYSSTCGCSSGQEIQCNSGGLGAMTANLDISDL